MVSDSSTPVIPGTDPQPPVMDSSTTASSHVAPDSSALERLHSAEREITYLRWSGMAFWLIVLLFHTQTLSAYIWPVYLSCFAFTALVQFRLGSRRSPRMNAWITMIGDPLLAAAICSVTGGIDSVFVPFLYFTSLAAAFRFGIRETLVILSLNFALSTLLYLYASSPSVQITTLFVTVFYNGMAAAIGTMFAGWARANLALAEAQSGALERAHTSIRSLLHRLINAQEAERKNIADDLHDRMGARLFTLQQGIDSCREQVDSATVLDSRLTALAQETRACADDVRLLMNELRPTILDEFGIAETLNEFLTNMREHVPFTIEIQINPALRKWQSQQDALLFRLVQEATLNIRKHASATQLTLSLDRSAEGVTLTIADDGAGFDPDIVRSRHYGLLSMHERAEALGGVLKISSEPGGGTCITLQLPE